MDIENKLQEFKDTFLPEGFEWRKGQKEAITTALQAYIDKKKVVIIDAPVGSGKSIIGMAISWVLNQDSKRGFVLASDVALQEQYEKDFEWLNLKWGSVKGLDHYLCIDNMEKHSLGTCKIRGKQAKQMSCYDECPYYMARDFASSSPTSLMNYAYWLIMMNTVQHIMETPPFATRDFTICDEGHKILDIVQNQYTPKINKTFIDRLKKVTDFFDTHKVDDLYHDLSTVKAIYADIQKEENQDTLLSLLKELLEALKPWMTAARTLKSRIKEDYPHDPPPKSWRNASRTCEGVIDFYIKIKEYCDIIDNTSTRNLVKNPGMDGEIVFNCLEESYIMNRYFHRWTGFTVIMSATFSDPKEYLKQIAVPNAKYVKLESTFDFSRSPIYYYNQKRMGFKHIQANLPWLYNTIDNIIDQHPGQNGVIHSASYKLTMDIYQGLSKKNRGRVLIYEGTKEKREVINQLKMAEDKILMGPSLLEGLDLKHDWSRFQIFAKVPYLSLGDRFVKAKMNLNPNWYRWSAILNILQGIGRSIRSPEDWAVTYFLDASLSDLIRQHGNAFPPEFMQRIRVRRE